MTDEMKRFRLTLAKIAELASEAAGDSDQPDADEPQTKNGASRKPAPRRGRGEPERPDALRMRSPDDVRHRTAPQKHVYRRGVVCGTDKRGQATPDGRGPTRIRVDATEGFIPLWAKDTVLRWKFRESSLQAFADPDAAKATIEQLFNEAVLAWGDAAPVRFSKQSDAWDFEIVMRSANDCDDSGCVLASAFFPDSGRHQLYLYPKMFEQSRQEEVETLVHEIGHVFGLRHFFANTHEQAWPSEVFGTDSKFSIMNYGEHSVLTDADRDDLKRLYEAVWGGELTDLNGTPFRLFRPYHTFRDAPDNLAAAGQRHC